jgi:DNA-binding response OmpR family regulator
LKNQAPKCVNLRLVEPVSRRILLVEDDDDVAEATGELLQMEGHSVCIARSGREALERLRTFRPEVVFLDVGLPDMEGYQVARRMRDETDEPELLIITLSGHGDEPHRRQSVQAGCDEHMVKPIELEILRNAVARIGSRTTGLRAQTRSSAPAVGRQTG